MAKNRTIVYIDGFNFYYGRTEQVVLLEDHRVANVLHHARIDRLPPEIVDCSG